MKSLLVKQSKEAFATNVCAVSMQMQSKLAGIQFGVFNGWREYELLTMMPLNRRNTKLTVGGKFIQQLSSLRTRIGHTIPYFSNPRQTFFFKHPMQTPVKHLLHLMIPMIYMRKHIVCIKEPCIYSTFANYK